MWRNWNLPENSLVVQWSGSVFHCRQHRLIPGQGYKIPHTSRNSQGENKRNLPTLLVGIANSVVVVENRMEIPQKVNRITIWSSNPTSWVYIHKKWKQKWTIKISVHQHSYIHNIGIFNSQKRKTTQMTTEVWMDKQNGYTLLNRLLLNHKREFLTHAITWMNLKTWNNLVIQKDIHCTIPLTWGSRVVKFTDRKENGSYQRAEARENRSYCLVIQSFSWQDKNSQHNVTDLITNWTQKMVKMANFICTLYHIFF